MLVNFSKCCDAPAILTNENSFYDHICTDCQQPCSVIARELDHIQRPTRGKHPLSDDVTAKNVPVAGGADLINELDESNYNGE
jgi:hypothetical protein